MEILKIFIAVLIGYLLGSFSSGYFFSKYYFKEDIRDYGSGNTGATNALRVYGKKIGLMTAIIDVFKGWLAVVLMGKILGQEFGYIAGLSALIGHIYPFYMGFKGGKGVACAAGMILAIDIRIFCLAALIFFAVALLTRYVSLASISAAVCMLIATIFLRNIEEKYLFTVVFLSVVLVIYKHKENIKRLIAGNENRLSFKKKGQR